MRLVIAMLAALVLAGCLRPAAPGDDAGTAPTVTAEPFRDAHTERMGHGARLGAPYDVFREATVELTMTADRPASIYAMDGSQLQPFVSGGAFTHYPHFSRERTTSASVEAGVRAGQIAVGVQCDDPAGCTVSWAVVIR